MKMHASNEEKGAWHSEQLGEGTIANILNSIHRQDSLGSPCTLHTDSRGLNSDQETKHESTSTT